MIRALSSGSPCGGIGRRGKLKICCRQRRASSTLAGGTNKTKGLALATFAGNRPVEGMSPICQQITRFSKTGCALFADLKSLLDQRSSASLLPVVASGRLWHASTQPVSTALVSQKNAHLLESPPDHVLEAYPAAKRPAVRRAIEASGKRVFLNSGAYVVQSQGKSIDLREYTKFIRDNQTWIEYAAALDVIGDPETSYDNLRRMEDDLGTRMVLPTFHVDEDEKWLERYLTDGHTHICLGGMVRCPIPKLSVWLSRLWPRYLDRPDLKVHGFGLTAPRVLLAFPWYSVDSTTWATAAKHGTIIMNLGRQSYARVSLASRSAAQRDPLSLKSLTHFDLLKPWSAGRTGHND